MIRDNIRLIKAVRTQLNNTT